MDQPTAQLVIELHQRTDLPVLECKKLLESAGGDLATALRLVEEQRLSFADPAPPLGFWEQFQKKAD